MTLQEQLKDADSIFTKIHQLCKQGFYQEAYEIIQTENPPQSWIVELESRVKKGEKYKTIKIELLEAAVRKIFGICELRTIETPVIHQDKAGMVSVTVVAKVETKYLEGRPYPLVLSGVATEVVDSAKLLPLATPKASSMAVKNAIKQLGKLFGKYLNNEAEELELPIESDEKHLSPEQELEAITEGILAAKTIADLKSWRHLVYAKKNAEQQNLYESKLRQLQSVVN
jgi:hypothetical protein